MAVGSKAGKGLIVLVALALLVQPIQCRAASALELYQLYGKDYVVEIPEDITRTISTYNGAKRYVSMYSCVVASEYDTQELTAELNQCRNRIQDISSYLIDGYSRSQSELAMLESEYAELYNRIEAIESTLISYDVEVTSISSGDVPTYSEYSEAMRKKNDLQASLQIGNIQELEVPAQSSARLLSNSDDMCSYRVVDGTGVLSVFNGVVEDVIVSDDYGLTVIVDNNNGIHTYFCNLEYADVVPGETVYQNQRVGYVYGTKLILRMQLGDEFVDISKLFKEE